MDRKLNWGILGTGAIAKVFAKAVINSKTGKLVAIGSRKQETSDKFGEEFHIPYRYGNYESVLSNPEVEAVYIALPHPMHAEWAIKSSEAKKHILCEKPLTLNYPECMAVIESAYENDVFLMEAFMYRCHPQTAKLIELIKQKEIGEVKLIHATFSFHAPFNLQSRLFNNSLGGGGILDVGCYCTSMCRLIAGLGKNFVEPIEVKGIGHIGEVSKVDEYACGILKFPGGIIGQISSGVGLGQESVVKIFGTEGYIFVPSPWIPSREGGTTEIIVYKKGIEKAKKILIETKIGLYSFEVDLVAENLEKRQAPFPAMNWEDTLGNMKTLDAWRHSIGMMYDIEKVDAYFPTVNRAPLKIKPNNMKYGKIKDVNKPISRIIMGTMLEGSYFKLPHASVMFDHFFQKGGNCFDTAYVYGTEKILGRWIKNRNIREKVVIIGKGAHTPFCTPEYLTKQLLESLENLQTDYIDIYLLHRDNPDIPVKEFIDVLNEHKNSGRICSFGVSNWSLKRVEEANKYAYSKNISGFVCVSNNFSLAKMVQPPWEGCISSSDVESCTWFIKTQIPLISWSSQARGFFTEQAKPDYLSDTELVRCWYSEENFKRKERAEIMAKKKGVLPINIALAYVLCQVFPTFAIIGPRTLSELNSSISALDIQLTPEEISWLEKGE